MEIMTEVINRRHELGISSYKLAKHIGISINAVAQIEQHRNPKLSNLLKICDALGLALKIERKEDDNAI